MSEFEMDFGEHLLDLIAAHIGDDGLKDFIRDFAEWAEYVLDSDDDNDDESVASIDTEADLSRSVCESYTMNDVVVDEEGFWSLKEENTK